MARTNDLQSEIAKRLASSRYMGRHDGGSSDVAKVLYFQDCAILPRDNDSELPELSFASEPRTKELFPLLLCHGVKCNQQAIVAVQTLLTKEIR